MRTYPVILDHLDAVVACLKGGGEDTDLEFPVDYWERPKVGTEIYGDPPFALVRPMPSAGQFMGPISDTQVDIILRVQVLATGTFERQAIRIGDKCRARMQKELITIPNRRVMDVRLMTVTGGLTRDDDLPTPFFYSIDVFELQTTPA